MAENEIRNFFLSSWLYLINIPAYASEFVLDGNISIEADSATILHNKEQIIFSGNVVAHQDKMTINADNVMILSIKENNSYKIIANGHVVILFENNRAQSGYGEYDVGKKLITLKNNVKLRQGTKVLTCSELQYDMNSKLTSLFSSDNEGRAQIILEKE